MEEPGEVKTDTIGLNSNSLPDEAIDVEPPFSNIEGHTNSPLLNLEDQTTSLDYSRPLVGDEVRTFDGKIAEDEIAADALNHQYLLDKIDVLLDKLNLDA
jgi:hypothetical protein